MELSAYTTKVDLLKANLKAYPRARNAVGE